LDDIRVEVASVLNTEQQLLKERQAEAAQQRYILAVLIGMALLTATILAGVLAVSTRSALKGLLDLNAELDAESKLRRDAERHAETGAEDGSGGPVERRHRP
jgi:hypothetical protein